MADNFIIFEINLISGAWKVTGTTKSLERANLEVSSPKLGVYKGSYMVKNLDDDPFEEQPIPSKFLEQKIHGQNIMDKI